MRNRDSTAGPNGETAARAIGLSHGHPRRAATPAVLIDLDILERATSRGMQERARAAGVKLRPHAKTHKSPEVGQMQIAAGASGLTLAKTSEAEVFAAHGLRGHLPRLPDLRRGQGAAAARPRRPRPPGGRRRQRRGRAQPRRRVPRRRAAAGRAPEDRQRIPARWRRPEDAVAMARRIAELPGIRLAGIFTHAGQGYGGPTPADVARTGGDEGRVVVEAAAGGARRRAAGRRRLARLDAHGARGMVVARRHRMPAGNVRLQRPSRRSRSASAQLEDCAMTVLATVVSVPARDRAVVDAGSKTLSTDPMRPNGGRQRFRRRAPPAASRAPRRNTASSPSPRANPSASASACGFSRTTPAPSPISTTASSPSGAAASREKSVWLQEVASSR